VLLASSILAIGAVGWAGAAPVAVVALAAAFVAGIALSVPDQAAPANTTGAAVVGSSGLSEMSARSLAAAVPDPLIIFDRDGVIVHANAPARATFGKIDAGTILALRFRAPEIQDLLSELIAGAPGPRIVEYAERVPIERWFRIAGMPVLEIAGLFVLAFKDQSELRRIDRMRSDFIANASHELRTPLASIAGFIDTLRGPARNDPEAREKFLRIMQSQTARMARLIDDLLSLSRLEMKPYGAPAELIDLRPLVESVVDALGHLAAESGVTIEKQMPPEPVEIRGHKDELTQVFENLLENACKYGQSGGRVVVRVEPAGEDEEDGARVTVTDFGPGIAEEHIPRITERFYRVDVDTSRAQKGTGLGLAIVKHILTRHKARLSVKSELGKGAAFTVHFPGN
jgi:two-component system phosphate regulon sensor histidine kinase PhoR